MLANPIKNQQPSKAKMAGVDGGKGFSVGISAEQKLAMPLGA